MFTELKNVVLSRWEGWNLGPVPDDISVIRRSSTWLGEAGKEVYFIFRRGDEVPSLFGKTVASAAHGETIRKEAQNARFVWDGLSGAFRNSVPQPLGLSELNGIPIYFEKAVPGVAFPEKVSSCWTEKSRNRVIGRTVIEISRWLGEFHNAMGTTNVVINSEFVQKQFIRPLSSFKSTNILDREELRYLARIEDIASSLKGESLMMPPVHGDLWGGSLLWGLDKGLHVIDWEFFEPQGLPLYDFLYFAVHPGFVIHSKAESGLLGEFMNLFYDNYLSRLIREHLKVQAKAAGLESIEIIEFLLSMLLIHLSLERDSKRNAKTSWIALIRYFVENRSSCKITLS